MYQIREEIDAKLIIAKQEAEEYTDKYAFNYSIFHNLNFLWKFNPLQLWFINFWNSVKHDIHLVSEQLELYKKSQYDNAKISFVNEKVGLKSYQTTLDSKSWRKSFRNVWRIHKSWWFRYQISWNQRAIFYSISVNLN